MQRAVKMGEVLQEKMTPELTSYSLRFRPFTSIFSSPEKKTKENKEETKVGSEQGYYKSLLSRFIIGDDIFKCLDDTKLEKTKNDNGLEIQATKKSVDKLKRKIKRSMEEKARSRKDVNRKQKLRGDKPVEGDGRKKGDKEGGRKGKRKGKGRGGGGGSRSPSPSRSGRSGKMETKDKLDRKSKKKIAKEGTRSSSMKVPRFKNTKTHGKGFPRVNKRIPRPPKRRGHQDGGYENDIQGEVKSRYHRRRRGSGSPSEIKDDIRARGGRYGTRRRKKFRYRKAILRRIKARYMKEKAKKIFKAKMKRGHKIKYWRKTPKNIEKQRRIGLEREYGKRGAYEILAYEHRLMRIREAKEELARLERKGKVGEFHSGDEGEVEDNRTLEELQDAIKKRKLLKVSAKVQRLLKKSSAHLKLNSQKKKIKGPKYLQTLKEYPKGFYEEFKDTLTINDTKYLNRFNKIDIINNPNNEERFVVEEVNYEDPWEEPERNRIMKVKQKRVKINVLKDYYKKKLIEEKRKKKRIPAIDCTEPQQTFTAQEDMKTQILTGTTETRGDDLIQGSFQRQVFASWKKSKNQGENSPFKSKQFKMRPQKYQESVEKQGSSRMTSDMVTSEYSEDEQSRNNQGSYEEYSDIEASGSNSGGNSHESEDEDGSSDDDERVYEERESEYSRSDQESDSEVDDESQTSNDQRSLNDDYSSDVESLSEYSGSEQESYSDVTYDSE